MIMAPNTPPKGKIAACSSLLFLEWWASSWLIDKRLIG
jgi:hypothetical protein